MTYSEEKLAKAREIWRQELQSPEAFPRFKKEHLDTIDVLDAFGVKVASQYAYWLNTGRAA